MRAFWKAVLLALVPLVLFASPATDAEAGRLRAMEVVDQTGTMETISDPSISHADDKCSMDQYLGLTAPGQAKKSVFVHYSQVRKISLKSVDERIEASVLLDGGEVLKGILPDKSMTITGKGELGAITYDDIGKIKTIEFTRFSAYKDGEEIIMDREAAASDWKEGRKELAAWRITDGKEEFVVGGFALRDCFTREDPFSFVKKGLIYVQRRERVGEVNETITVRRGVSRVELAVDDFESVEITGKMIDDMPEVVLKKGSGKEYRVALLLSGVDEDDMLVWRRPYGWEGVPLLPQRKISLVPVKLSAPAPAPAPKRPDPKKEAPKAAPEEKTSGKKDMPAKRQVEAAPVLKSAKGAAGSIESVPQTKGRFKKNSTITFKNNSGRPALVKVVGPTKRLLKVRVGKGRTVKAPVGRYRIFVRFGGGPDDYAYAEGDPFEVVETDTEYSVTTITLHDKGGGNYNSRPVSREEFEKGQGAGGPPE